MNSVDRDIINQNISRADLQRLRSQNLNLKKKTEKVESLKSPLNKNDLKKEQELKEACAGFEAVFLQEMMKSMRDTLPGDALFEDSNGMNIYKSMYDQYLSDQLSKGSNSIGLKEFLYKELKSSI